MPKKLVIVESPSKSKTIEKYLGDDYKVVSSKGHIRDLATTGKFGLGVDIENHFKPNYKIISGKKKDVDSLKKDCQKSDFIYLATDPDREGEAISYHLYDELGLNDQNSKRIVFNEVTKNAVLEAIKNPRMIDKDLVNSQETRRILDRIIGFRLSKLMQSKTSGKSAGRVQSVALKLIVDRERERDAFKEEEYWTITAHFKELEADLFNYQNKKIEIKNEREADDILNQLDSDFKVENAEQKQKKKSNPRPFTTSTLQQNASNKLNMNARRTMSIAQKLYEGIDIGSETVGLITYMRTDSTRLSNDFTSETISYIEHEYGKEYVGQIKKTKKKENIQDAHEAIRPTSIKRDPLHMKKYLSDDEFKLYRMIYYRALASLMSDAKTNQTTIILENKNYQFKATGSIITFDGYLKVYKDYENTTDKIVPILEANQTLVSDSITKEQHFTQPPARYTEATLVKTMEELGIGRPSTYATIMGNIKDRGYVILDKKSFLPTDIGFEVTDKLQEYFDHIINVKYTASMENNLDEIADGKIIWYETLEKFYNEFEPSVEEAFNKMEKKPPEQTGEECPNCHHPLVKRKGKYGEFVACSNFPECRYIKNDQSKIVEICPCPSCDGKIVEKKSRKGKLFYGCNNYPKCKNAYWDKPTGKLCPKCNSMLVEKKGIIKCSNCDYEN